MAVDHHVSQEERARQDDDHQVSLDRDRSRRDRVQQPDYQYLPVFDDLEKDLGYCWTN